MIDGRLKIGLVGASNFGQYHLEGMQRSPHVAGVAICGRNLAALEGRRQQFSCVSSVHTEFAELLDDPSVDLIDIVLPHDLHLPFALRALEAGKHVLVEKPPARTTAEFQQMLYAAESAGRRVFVVMNLLFTAIHRVARRVVDSGTLGTPFLSLEVTTSQALRHYVNADHWVVDRERSGGGIQIDGGFHAVYRQLYMLESLGAPTSVLADCAQIGVYAPTKGEDFSALTLAYLGGARIHLMNQWTARASLGRFPSGILGTEGSLLFTGDAGAPLLIRRPERDDEVVPVPEGPRAFIDSAARCVEVYLDCLAAGKPAPAGTDLAMLTLEAINGAYRSSAEGRRIPLTGAFRTSFGDDFPQ